MLKDTTIRPPRRVKVLPGDRLQFFSGLRTRKVKKFGTSTVKSVTQLSISKFFRCDKKINLSATYFFWMNKKALDYFEIRTIAKRDGFAEVGDFIDFFERTYGIPTKRKQYLELEIIEWENFKPTK